MEKVVLNNGIILYLDPVPEARTIGLAVAVKTGSIYEEPEFRGISHLLEHMMFKSNKKYTTGEINSGLELCGGVANAFTSTFLTYYIVESIPEGFPKILDIIYSMLENEKYLEKEFELEKKVVLTEIERYENNPESRLSDLIPKSIYGDSDYGDPIGGYRKTVENITKEDLEEYKAKMYVSENMFMILSGNFNKKYIDLVKSYFEKLEERKPKLKKPSKDKGQDIKIKMDTKNQVYYALNFRVCEDYHKIYLFEKLFSGGLSSLIHQVIREKYGIGYCVSLNCSYEYPDEFIISLEIPGFEKDREKILDNAINELFNKIENEKLDDYFEGRLRRLKLLYEKSRNNIFSRLASEVYFTYYFEENYDEFYRKIFSLNPEEVRKLVYELKDGKTVIISQA